MRRPSPRLSAIDAGLIDPAQTARFAAALKAVWRRGGAPDSVLGVAVSGGPDSLGLLLLAAAALPGRVEAATVDHGLRAESSAEAAFVAEVCAGLGVRHETLRVTVAEGNLQSEARAARYRALADWAARRGIGALATAHHADDQAETLLLRLNRASGVAGLAGVRAVGRVPGTDLPLVRPLLDWRRADLAEVVRAAGLEAVQDPSNDDARFDRVRVRAALAGADWLDVAAVAESAGHLAEADAALDWATAREWREGVKPGALGSYLYRPSAPRAIALRVLALLVTKLDGAEPRGSGVARVFDALVAGQPASIGNLVARPTPDGWSFNRAPARRN